VALQIPVLTYHSAQVNGLDYERNDHVALRDDLQVVCAEGFRVVPVSWVVDWLQGARPDHTMQRTIAITFDDGCSMDFLDMVHPRWGSQRSFFGILGDLQKQIGPHAQPTLHSTAFVIASPETRSELGHTNLAGPEWISDDWWAAAAQSGLMSVENHSWDHNHPSSSRVCQRQQVRGRFDNIETYDECDAEVCCAATYIESKTGLRPDLFAYPWGQASSYLRDEYFPHHSASHGCRAAFTAHDGFVTRNSSIWAIPRMVFGANWTTPEQFRSLLRDV